MIITLKNSDRQLFVNPMEKFKSFMEILKYIEIRRSDWYNTLKITF